MIIRQTPMEYFRDLVEGAMRNQRIDTPEEVGFYLSSLLECFVEAERLYTGALALQYMKAIQSEDIASQRLLRELGDISLFVSGFFPESLTRKIAGIRYYMAMGALSYGRLGAIYSTRPATANVGAIFNELSERFTSFVNVLSEVSESTSLGRSSDVLALYERWLATKSSSALSLLRDLGIEPCETDMKNLQ